MHVERRSVRLWDNQTRDFVNVTVQVEIDITQLAEAYARKARDNKSRHARMLHGAVVIKHKEG